MAEKAPAPRVFFSALIAIWRRNYPIRELGWSGVGSGCEVLVITNNPSLLVRRLTSLCFRSLSNSDSVRNKRRGKELHFIWCLRQSKKTKTKTTFSFNGAWLQYIFIIQCLLLSISLAQNVQLLSFDARISCFFKEKQKNHPSVSY